MKNPKPPRVALALLERFVPESAPLAGDLVEEFELRPSRTRLWWQVITAIAIQPFNGSDEIRPLRLVDLQPSDALERTRALSRRFTPVNMTASPVYGIGGLGLVAMSLLLSLVVPGVWWILLASISAGVVLGFVMVARERRRSS